MNGSDALRGTGRTTRQMLKAPQGAVFVVHTSAMISHARSLAEKHGRQDLQIVSCAWLTGQAWRGAELSGVIVDHAARLTCEESTTLHDYILPRIRP